MNYKEINMIPITIQSFVYNPKSKILTATFGMPTSCVYSFANVPEEIVIKLREAENVEGLRDVFNNTVRGIYKSTRVL